MGFTDPFTGLTPARKLTTEEIMRAIRLDAAAELDAINLYQAHIDAIDDEKVKLVIAHIRDEEKEHLAEFTALLNYLDETQRAHFAAEDVAEIQKGNVGAIVEEEAAALPSEEPAPALPDGPVADGPQFTVGSLLGQDQ